MLFRWKRFDKRRQNAHGFTLFSSSFSRKRVSKKAAAMLKVGPSLSSQAFRNMSGVSRSSFQQCCDGFLFNFVSCFGVFRYTRTCEGT